MTNPISKGISNFNLPPELQNSRSVKERIKQFEPASKIAAPPRPTKPPALTGRTTTTQTPSRKDEKPVNEKKLASDAKQEVKHEEPYINFSVKVSREEERQLKIKNEPTQSPPKPRAATLTGVLNGAKKRVSKLTTTLSSSQSSKIQPPFVPKRELEFVRNSVANAVPSPSEVPLTPLLKGEWTNNFNDLEVIFHKAIKGPVFSGGAYFVIQERTASSQKWETGIEYQVLIAVQYYQHWYNFEQRYFETVMFTDDPSLKIVCHLERGAEEQLVKHNTKILREHPSKRIAEEKVKQYAFIDQSKMYANLMRVRWPEKGPFKPCFGDGSFTSGLHPRCTLEEARKRLPILVLPIKG